MYSGRATRPVKVRRHAASSNGSGSRWPIAGHFEVASWLGGRGSAGMGGNGTRRAGGGLHGSVARRKASLVASRPRGAQAMRIFLSAVTAQFKECRDALASDLRAVGAEVRVQEDFTQGTGTL